MTRRGVETVLAVWTLVFLAAYIPLETWGSWQAGLLDPHYLIDAIAMILLLWGAVHSLRSRPRPAPEVLAIAAAWASANGWRATLWRYEHIRSGGTLAHGMTEMWAVAIATALGLASFVTILVLVALKSKQEATSRR
jgi:hypothetical protein